MKNWDKELTLQLICLFHVHKCLWDPSFKTKRKIRYEAWEEITQELKRTNHCPDLEAQTVRNKMVYMVKEYVGLHRMKQKTGVIPRWRYYDLLKFIPVPKHNYPTVPEKMSKPKWSQEETSKLIELVKPHFDIWGYFQYKITLQDHCDVLQTILPELQEKCMENLTIEALKAKLYNLKFCYLRYFKLKKMRQKIPLWWFPLVSENWEEILNSDNVAAPADMSVDCDMTQDMEYEDSMDNDKNENLDEYDDHGSFIKCENEEINGDQEEWNISVKPEESFAVLDNTRLAVDPLEKNTDIVYDVHDRYKWSQDETALLITLFKAHLDFWEYFESRLSLQDNQQKLKIILKELQNRMPNLTMKGLKAKVHNLKFCYRRHLSKSLDKEPLWWLELISKDWKKHAKIDGNKNDKSNKKINQHERMDSDDETQQHFQYDSTEAADSFNNANIPEQQKLDNSRNFSSTLTSEQETRNSKRFGVYYINPKKNNVTNEIKHGNNNEEADADDSYTNKLEADDSDYCENVRHKWTTEETKLLIKLLNDFHFKFWEYFESKIALQDYASMLEKVLQRLQKTTPSLTLKSLKAKIHNLKYCLRRSQRTNKIGEREAVWWIPLISKDWHEHNEHENLQVNNGDDDDDDSDTLAQIHAKNSRLLQDNWTQNDVKTLIISIDQQEYFGMWNYIANKKTLQLEQILIEMKKIKPSITIETLKDKLEDLKYSYSEYLEDKAAGKHNTQPPWWLSVVKRKNIKTKMNSSKSYDSNSCRICLEVDGVVCLSDKIYYSNVTKTYLELFESYLHIKRNDKTLPQKLCGNCALQLRATYELAERAARSNEILQNSSSDDETPEHLYNEDSFKQETVEIPLNNINEDVACADDDDGDDDDEEELIEEIDLNDDDDDDEYLLSENNESSCEYMENGEYVEEQEVINIVQKEIEENNNSNQQPYLLAEPSRGRLTLCHICSQFIKSENFEKHSARHKVRERNYECELCGLKSFTLAESRMHMQTHDPNRKKHQCDQCDKSYYYRNGLTQHLRTHTGELLKCHLCPKGFINKFQLKDHINIHLGQRPYECEYCHKTFLRNTHYNAHKATHQDFRYKCQYCPREYRDQKCFKVHMAKHLGKSYGCLICDKTFVTRFVCRVHITNVHKIEDDPNDHIAFYKKERMLRMKRTYRIKDMPPKS